MSTPTPTNTATHRDVSWQAEHGYGFLVDNDMKALGEARKRLVRHARTWFDLDAAAAYNLEVCAGEVLRNAITHTGSSCAVAMAHDGNRIRVEVTDFRPLTEAHEDWKHGIGLSIVANLARSWGARPDYAGKVVWFDIDVAAPTADVTDPEAYDAYLDKRLAELIRSCVGAPPEYRETIAGTLVHRLTTAV